MDSLKYQGTFNFSIRDSVMYSLTCANQSTSNWKFYMYQRVDSQPSDLYSLAWLVSPLVLSPNSYMVFQWSEDYSFVWYGEGKCDEGVVYPMGGSEMADIVTANSVMFDFSNEVPSFIDLSETDSQEYFSINISKSVPNYTFSTGIGVSSQGAFITQSSVNTVQKFYPNSNIWIGAAAQMEPTQILSETISNTAVVQFPVNIYDRTAIFKEDNTWEIT